MYAGHPGTAEGKDLSMQHHEGFSDAQGWALLELEPGLSYPCTAQQPPDRLQSASQGAETKRPKTVMGTVPRSKKAELSQLV